MILCTESSHFKNEFIVEIKSHISKVQIFLSELQFIGTHTVVQMEDPFIMPVQV